MKKLLLLISLSILSSAICANPGDLDTTFGMNGGYIIPDFGAAGRDERPRDSIVQADGKIIVVGRTETATANIYDLLVARYNADGTPDTAFSGDGFHTVDFGGQFDTGNAVAIQTDGKIVVAGGIGDSSFFSYVLRFNTDGTLDTSFDTDGIARLTGPGEALSVAIQTNGNIVFTAAFDDIFGGYRFSVARLNANGSPDTTFDGDGQLTISPNVYFPHGLALQTDGKIIVAGTSSTSSSSQDVALIRLNSDGTYDTTFDGDGIVQTVVPSEDSEARSVIIQSDGKILVGGGSQSGSQDSPLLIRYNSDGSLDTSFDGDGINLIDIPNFTEDGFFHDVVQQTNGKIVAIYSNETEVFPFPVRDDFYIFRFKPEEGVIDTTYDFNGIIKSQRCENGTELALQPDGKIIALGSLDRVSDSNYDHGICVQRFNTDGTVDYSFNSSASNGKTVISGFGLTEVSAVAGLPNGKIMVAGFRDYTNGGVFDAVLLRLNANGSLDTSFMDEGFYIRTASSTTSPNRFYDLQILSDGSFFVAGEAGTSGGIIAKFNSAGVPDTTFSGDGVTTTTNIGRIYGLAIQPDGKIIGCGSSGSVTLRGGRIARFSATGTYEVSAGNNMGVSGNNNEILECGLQSDGKLVVAGFGFDNPGNDDDNVVVSRHLSDLSIDTTFGTSGVTTTNMSPTLNDRATDMVVQPDNKIVVSSMGLNGTGDRDFAVLRYDANGTLDTSFTENFGSDGISLINFGVANPNDEANALLLQPDGQILVGGMSDSGTNKRFGLAKLNPGGSLALGFGTLGRTTVSFPNNDANINALGFYSNDKILAAGKTFNGTDYDFAIARYENEFIPTAANVSISGRVVTSKGSGIRNATVTLTDVNGSTLTARTSTFGYYRFEEVRVGETYVMSVASKRFRFVPADRILTVTDELTDVDFVAQE